MIQKTRYLLVFALLYLNVAKTDELKLYIIQPKNRINWSSPRSLFITSGRASLGNDYAPIGHFAVELNCTNFNKYGIRNILTGMERENKVLSRHIVIDKKLGLGSLTYSFKGDLQTKKNVINEITLAQNDNRIETIIIPTSSSRCDLMMDFLDQWIESGAYTVYGGGKDISAGEGSGCADFAMEFFKIATQSLPPQEWIASVNIPLNLIGNGNDIKVSSLKLLLSSNWAQTNTPALKFSIADSNKVQDWLKNQAKSGLHSYHYTSHLNGKEIWELPMPKTLTPFKYFYPTHSSSIDVWERINNKNLLDGVKQTSNN